MGRNRESENAVPPERRREEVFTVVVNHEGQHSIWRARCPLPAGWTETGVRGHREECVAHIGRAWTDLRPLSLRRQMEAGAPEVPS